MRKLLTLAILLVAATTAMAQGLSRGGLVPGTQPGRFQDLTEDYTTGKRTVSDGLARVAVFFDDGDITALTNNEVWQFVSRGIPIGLSLNYEDLSAAAIDSIQSLMAQAPLYGSSIEIVQHGNNSGALTRIYPTAADAGYDSLLYELNTDNLAAAFGQRPRIFVVPGDAKVHEWYTRNLDMISVVLDSLGIKYGMVGSKLADNDSTAFSEMFPRQVATDGYTALGGEVALPNHIGQRPGLTPNQYLIPRPTWDLGNLVVERGIGNISGTSAWSIADPDGDGAVTGGGDATQYYYKTAWFIMNACLSNNLGFAVVMHDSTRADNGGGQSPSITGITGDELNGNWSPTHIAVVLRALADAGHIVLATPTEYCEWMMGEYAPGTDLIANPSCLIPQFDIGDTVGLVSEYANPRGLSFAGASRPLFDATYGVQSTVGYWTGSWDRAAAPLAKFDRSGKDPDEYIGAGITGYLGRPGGIHYTAANDLQYLQIIIGGLRPGAYRFSFARTGGAAMTVKEIHFAAVQKSMSLEATWENEGSTVYADTLLSWRWEDSDVTISSVGAATKWTTQPVDFILPEYPPGDFNETAHMWGREATGMNLMGTNERDFRTDTVWAFTILMDFSNGATISYPVLRYMGER